MDLKEAYQFAFTHGDYIEKNTFVMSTSMGLETRITEEFRSFGAWKCRAYVEVDGLDPVSIIPRTRLWLNNGESSRWRWY